MKIEELIARVDEAYGDGLVQEYFDDRNADVGDTLAKFIAIELEETFDENGTDDEQLEEARRVLGNAVDELNAVIAQAL